MANWHREVQWMGETWKDHSTICIYAIKRKLLKCYFWHQELGLVRDSEAGHLQPSIGDARRHSWHGHGLRAHGVPLQIGLEANLLLVTGRKVSKQLIRTVWLDVKIIFQYLALTTMKIWPILIVKIAKVGSKCCQILSTLKIYQNNYKILPKLVTLDKRNVNRLEKVFLGDVDQLLDTVIIRPCLLLCAYSK